MISYWIKSSQLKDGIFIPKYYDPSITAQLKELSKTHNCLLLADLVANGYLELATGNEIGKAAYGTGNIPFVRTSDISNWELKTIPKQGVSEEIYKRYADKQDVRPGDILFVRDGTYLIGGNCFITKVDQKILYQSHLLKFRIKKPKDISPYIIFLLLNSPIAQRQIRSFQFTADIIDTLGQRINELVLPIPKDLEAIKRLAYKAMTLLETRVRGKGFVKHCPFLIEETLESGSIECFHKFNSLSLDEVEQIIESDTVTSEFGSFQLTWYKSSKIMDGIYLPKYYDPTITKELKRLASHCDLKSIGELKGEGIITYQTGDEIGKMAYGTGDIPFIRTSDFANWEIKHDPKQGVSEEIYEKYAEAEDLLPLDLFLVRDGTYLVGSSCIVTEEDSKSLFCGGLFKIRTLKPDHLSPYLLLGIMNAFIVKRQIRNKQFTRDVIDTLGNRIDEIILPIPKSPQLRQAISDVVERVVTERISARKEISLLATSIA